VAIAAAAAAFWLGVATLRLLIHRHGPGPCPRAAPIADAPASQPSIAPLFGPRPMPDECGIEGWPHLRRNGWLTFRDVRCGIAAAKPEMRACQGRFADESFHATMDVLVGMSGKVLAARFRSSPAGSSLAPCLEGAMKSVVYPRSTARYEFFVAWRGLE
jgi:hypothetical protein